MNHMVNIIHGNSPAYTYKEDIQGVYLTLARPPEASVYHLGLVQSFPTLAHRASGPNVAIHHNEFIHIFACLYSVHCVAHISTQLAYCANLMVMLSCIAIMKLLHQTIAVETLSNKCYIRRV